MHVASTVRILVFFTLIFLCASEVTASDKEIAKSANVSSVEVGGTVIWTLTVKNTSTASGGPFDTPNAQVSDTVPSGFNITSVVTAQGTCNVSGQSVVCSLGTLAAGSTVTITITTTAVTAGSHTNTASITSGSFDPDSSNNSGEATVVVTEPSADMAITKTATPDSVTTGGAVTFTLTITNNGPDDATGVRVGDDLSAIFTGAAATASQGTCTIAAGNVIDCSLGAMPVGATATVTITTTADVEGTYTNTASVIADQADPVSTNNSDGASVTVQDNVADISVTKTASPDSARSGKDVVFTVIVTNNGPMDAEGVRLVDTLPSDDGDLQMGFVSVSPTTDCSQDNGVITCEIGSLASGASRTFAITTWVMSSRVLFNSVVATSTSPPDPDTSNNTASATVDGRHGKTTGHNPDDGDSADPVSVLTGEFFFDEESDISLPGSAHIEFERMYASSLGQDAIVSQPLGTNWTHSHNLGFSRVGDFAEVVSPRGRTFGFRASGSSWNLVSLEGGAYSLTETGTDVFAFVDAVADEVLVFASGHLSERHVGGFQSDYTWTGDDLTRIADAFGNSLTLTYSNGVISTISSGQETVSYTYTGSLLTGVTLSGSVPIEYEYDSGNISGLLTARRIPSGTARTSQVYDGTGRVTRQTDAGGGTTTFDYGAETTTVTYADGTSATYKHDSAGRLNEVTLQDGTEVDLSYSGGSRTQVTAADGTTSRTIDSSTNLPASFVATSGASVAISYTSVTVAGASIPKIASVTYPDAQSSSFQYNSDGRITRYVDPNGGVFTYTYNPSGLLTSATDPLNGSNSFTYNSNSTLASSTNELGDATQYRYDSAGRMTGVEHPDGSTSLSTYDAAGRLTSDTDPTGVVTQYGYDADGNVISVTDALGNSTTFSYDAMGRLTSVTDPLGNASSVTYNSMGDATSITDGDGARTTYSYDTLGRITAVNGRDGVSSTITRDTAGRVTSAARGSGSLSQTVNADGLVTSTTSPAGRRTSYTYDELGQKSSITRPDGGTITLTRDASGGITGMTLPNGSSASYELNDWGQVTSVTDPTGAVWTRKYDASGRLNGFTTPGGRSWDIEFDKRGNITAVVSPTGRTELTYDAARRLLSETFPGGLSRSFNYDAAGRLTGSGRTAFQLDARGEISSANDLTGMRDASGQLSSFTWPGGQSIAYTFDAAGRLQSVVDWVGGSSTFEYGTNGRLTSVGRPNDVTTNYTWDADGLVTRIEERSGNNLLAATELSRDQAGNATEASRMLPVVLQRVPRQLSTSYDTDGRSAGRAFDDAGRRTSDPERSYTWDGADRLVSAGSTSLEYDDFDQLIQIGDQAHTVSFLHDRAVSATITDSNAGTTWRYVYTPGGKPLFRIADADSARQFFHFDEAGNATILTNDLGETIAAWAFDPYGRIIGESGQVDPPPFLFAGLHGVMSVGESRLYRMVNRIYDAESGRFLSPEPVRDLTDPQALDPYTYAGQNPLRFVDPFGTNPQEAASSGSLADVGGWISSTVSAAGSWSEAAANGFGNSGITGFLDDIRGTTPNGGLHKGLRGNVVDAARDVAKHARAGNAKGVKSAAQTAKSLAAEANSVKKAGDAAGKLGAAATVAGVALAAYEAKGRFDKVDSQLDKELASASRMFDSTVRALMRSLKRGTITREQFQKLFKQAQNLHKSRIEAIKNGHLIDLGLEGTRFLIKGLETLIPIPVVSIGDGFGWVGSKLFGTPIPK